MSNHSSGSMEFASTRRRAGLNYISLATIFAQCAMLFRITPGNLGVGEEAIAVGSQLAGIGFAQGLAIAAAAWAVLLVVALPGGRLYPCTVHELGWKRSELGSSGAE